MKSREGFPQVEILIEPFQTHVFQIRNLQAVCFFGVPGEFQLEHGAGLLENAGFSAPELRSCLESKMYSPDFEELKGSAVYPNGVLNLRCDGSKRANL